MELDRKMGSSSSIETPPDGKIHGMEVKVIGTHPLFEKSKRVGTESRK